MKSIVLLSLLLFFQSSFSQTHNKWSVDGNIGFNSALEPFAEGYQSNYLGVYHADANVRYMFYNKFGVMGGLGFDRIKSDDKGWYQDEHYFKVHYIRASAQAVFNLGRIAEFEKLHDRAGLLLHMGLGFSSVKDAHRSVWFKNFRTQGTDEMMHFLIGLTPQVRIKDYLAIHLDFTYVANVWQTKTFDFTTPNEYHKGVDGRITTWSIGCSYYFGKDGKGKKHMDWVVDQPSSGSGPLSILPADTIIKKETIRTVETISIIHGDTTSSTNQTNPSQYDPNGDFDGDGIPNYLDECPTSKGTDANGCPNADRDEDGISNAIDDCPDIPGIMENGGCPGIDLAVKKVLREAMIEVDFEHGNDVLLEESSQYLDKVISVLNDHPEYKLNIDGYTDNSTEVGPSKALSLARAKKAEQYMIEKGIDAERLKSFGHGAENPISPNDNPQGREQNMRLEFNIKFE